MLLPFLLAALPGLQADAFPLNHLEADLRFLADDVLAGRDSRTFGGFASARWIESRYAALGLEPWRGNFRAPLRAAPVSLDPARTSLTLGDHTFTAGKNFLPHPSAPPGDVQGSLVFVDYGLAWSDPDFPGPHSARDVSVEGSVVLLLRFQPQAQDPEHPYFGTGLHPSARLQAKVHALQRAGARAILLADPPDMFPGPQARDAASAPYWPGYSDLYEVLLPTVRAQTESADLAATNLSPAGAADQLFSMAQNQAPLGADIPVAYLSRSAFEVAKSMVGSEVRVAVGHRTPLRQDAGNILGLLPTPSEHPQHGLIVIGAHYDHVGRNAAGETWNGADDNASGVVGLLALAEYFQDPEHALDRDILFIAFSGEERGLLGSFDLFASGHLDPEDLHLMLNLDMIGRASSGTVAAIGVGSSPPLLQMAKELAAASPLDVVFDDGSMFDRSDHLPFYLLGIPVLFLNSGEHADYHTPQDLWDRVDLPALRQILLYASAVLAEAASHPTDLPFHDYLHRRSARFGSPPRSALPWPIPFRQRLDY